MPADTPATGPVASLQTPRLLLRPLTLDDAQDYWPLVRDPDVLRHTGEQPVESLDAVRALLQKKPLADYAAQGFGRLAVVERSGGELVGWCGLKYLPDLDAIDIGYRFLSRCWGRGYATEAGAAVIEHGFRTLRLARIIGLVEPANTASARVLYKLGLRFERALRLPAHAQEVHLFAIAGAAT